ALSEGLVCDGGSTAGSCSVGGFTMPGGRPAPNVDCFGNPQAETGIIVKFNPAHNAWEDRLGRNWNNAVRFSLLDEDVFVIDAAGSPPAEVGVPYTGVGTILFDMVTNPVTGKVYVSNTEARNEVRFEGPGTCPNNSRTNTTVRGHLHDAVGTSDNGEASCSSCHVFGDFDGLAWDLGDPDAFPPTGTLNNPNPFRLTVGENKNFRALKGPMTTQSLRGLANAGPMHWRGDRTAGNDPGGNPLDENGAFLKFIVAFDGLLGKAGSITATEMQQLADFILQ